MVGSKKKKNKNKKLWKVIYLDNNSSFRPYTFTTRGIVEIQL